MKHLVLFSLFTVCASYSMDYKDLIKTDKNKIRALKYCTAVTDEKNERFRELIIKNKPYRDEQFVQPAIKADPYVKCALMRLPSDTGNENAHEVADLYVYYDLYRHTRSQTLDQDVLTRLAMRARTVRQFQVTDKEKKEVEELVVKKLEEDGLLQDLLAREKNEARPTKRYKIN